MFDTRDVAVQEVLPEGIYDAEVTFADWGINDNGNDQLVLKLQVLDGRRKVAVNERLVWRKAGGEVIEFNQGRITQLAQVLDAIDSRYEPEPKAMVGKALCIKLTETEYNGRERNEVVEFLKPGTAGSRSGERQRDRDEGRRDRERRDERDRRSRHDRDDERDERDARRAEDERYERRERRYDPRDDGPAEH